MKINIPYHFLSSSFAKLLLGVLLVNLLWYLMAMVWNIEALPNPLVVYKNFPTVFANGLSLHLWASLFRIVIGIFISLLIAYLLGVFLAMNRVGDRLFQPLLYLSYPVPKLALLPIVMLFFGIGETTKIVMIVLIVVFQLTIHIRDAIVRIPKENFYVLDSLHSSFFKKLVHIILPASLPEVLSALRVAVGIATSVLFVTETFGTDKGLGYFIVDAWMRIDYITMYVGIVTISVVGFLLFTLVDLLDVLLCRWNRTQPTS